MSNLNDDILEHLCASCHLRTLQCWRSPHITDRGVACLTRLPSTRRKRSSSGSSNKSIESIERKKSMLEHLVLDGANLSTEAVLEMARETRLVSLYLSTITPIISDATLGTLMNVLTSSNGGRCARVWLINTLTTPRGAPTSLRDMILHKNGDVRCLEELFIAEMTRGANREIQDMWPHVRVVRSHAVWWRDNQQEGGGSSGPRNGEERRQATLSAAMRNETEYGCVDVF